MGERKPLILGYMPIDTLVPYAGNARLHPPGQITKLAGIIKLVGFRGAVLVDGANGIIAGHGRVLAAKQAGLTGGPDLRLRRRGALSAGANRLLCPIAVS